MKRYSIFMVVAILLFTFAACDKNNMPGLGLTTDSTLTLTFEKELDVVAIGIGAQDYDPVGMRRSGGILSIASRVDGSDGVRTVCVSIGELLYSLTGWTYDGKAEEFGNQVTDVAVNSDYIFVVNRSSRIDMPRRNDYTYATIIRRTGW